MNSFPKQYHRYQFSPKDNDHTIPYGSRKVVANSTATISQNHRPEKFRGGGVLDVQS